MAFQRLRAEGGTKPRQVPAGVGIEHRHAFIAAHDPGDRARRQPRSDRRCVRTKRARSLSSSEVPPDRSIGREPRARVRGPGRPAHLDHRWLRSGRSGRRHSGVGGITRILSVTPDATVRLLGTVDGIDPDKHPGSWFKVARNTKLREMWQRGWTGDGIDVALIDSGVAPVPGLDMQVINGPDLSFDSQASNLTPSRHVRPRHPHGRPHRRPRRMDPPGKEDEEYDHGFVGAAPGARIVSIKVASSDGATDVSQVIAAIDWVVQHRNSDGLNIRVLNLSFGTDGTQDYRLDPLSYAAEVAWLHGIVVVVAAGNSGFGTPQLNTRLRPLRDRRRRRRHEGDGRPEGRRDPVVADARERDPPSGPGRARQVDHQPAGSRGFVDDVNPSARRDEPLLQGQRLVAGGRHRVRGRGDAPGPASRAHARSGEGAADADRRAAPQRGSRRAGCRPDQHAPREGGEGLDRRRRRADVAAINRARLAAARPRLGRRRGRGRDPRGANRRSSATPGMQRPGRRAAGTGRPGPGASGMPGPGQGIAGAARAGAREPGPLGRGVGTRGRPGPGAGARGRAGRGAGPVGPRARGSPTMRPRPSPLVPGPAPSGGTRCCSDSAPGTSRTRQRCGCSRRRFWS